MKDVYVPFKLLVDVNKYIEVICFTTRARMDSNKPYYIETLGTALLYDLYINLGPAATGCSSYRVYFLNGLLDTILWLPRTTYI